MNALVSARLVPLIAAPCLSLQAMGGWFKSPLRTLQVHAQLCLGPGDFLVALSPVAQAQTEDWYSSARNSWSA